jgi:uncharacterized cofD-like protein
MAGIEDHPLGQALEYRFKGTDVEGHALGNLLLAALGAVTGDFVAAADQVGELLGLDPERARAMPATCEPVELRATTADGRMVSGQVAVSTTQGVERVALDPPGAKPPPGLVDIVHAADQVVLGPGSLFTSVLAAAVVDDLRDAIAATRGQRVYVCNLRAERGETRGYDVARHVAALQAHGIEPDVVLVHRAAGAEPSPAGTIEGGEVARVVTADLARPPGVVHDPVKLGASLAALVRSP